jgi:hypothetical protein
VRSLINRREGWHKLTVFDPMLAKAGGIIITTTKQKSQLPAEAMALTSDRQRRGAISALYRNGPPTQASPKKVLKRNKRPAAASLFALSVVESRPAMTAKQADMPAAVNMNALRRPRPSMRRTDSREKMAYSTPPMAAMRCERLGSRLNDSCRILLAYVDTMLMPESCWADWMKSAMATR